MPIISQTTWDGGATTWDGGATTWDLVESETGGSSIGFALFEGKTPDWVEKRRLVLEESERQAKRRQTIKPVEIEDVSITTDFNDDWANLGSILKGYGSYLKPSMSALDKFLEAKSKREAREALKKLQIQLEDEIILMMAASV